MNLISINIYRDRIQFEVFSIYNDKRDIIIQNEIRIPVSFSMGDKLEYIRKFMSMIINQNKVKKAYLNIKDKLEVYTIKIEGSTIKLWGGDMQLSTQFDFEVINNIKSEGVNSSLYMVKDLQVGSKFILKQIDKKGLKEPERYFEESKKIYKLKHPNIMEIHSASYDNEYIYITMPYLKNGSLQHLIENQNLTLRQIIKYSLDFLSAIYYVHENNIVHCDIKPNNILISNEGSAILTDFGSALYLNNLGNARLKNVYYKHIAPEQCTNSTINKKIDIYQIGTTLYRLCNGNEEYNKQARRYKDLNSLKIACAKGKFPIRKKYLPHIPKEMINIIEKCINVNTYDRYDNVLQIMNDISSINTHLDWYYNKENEEKFTWTLNTNDNYINIMLLKVGTMWEIIDDYRESLYVETKAKGYRAIRDIIKKYEKIALL